MRIKITELDMNNQETFNGGSYTKVSAFDGENMTTTILDHRDMEDSWSHCVLLAMERCMKSVWNQQMNHVEI